MDNLAATGGVPGPGRIGRVAIGDLLKRAARRFPDRIAVTDGARQVTFTEIERDANRFANYLVARGLKPGEKISTICNNSVEFVKALFGIHRAGLVWVPVNTMLGPSDMDYILGHAEVRFALIDDNLHAQADRRAALERRGVELIAIDLGGTAKAAGLEEFNESAARPVRHRARDRDRRPRSRDDHLHLGHDLAAEGRDALPSRRGDGGHEQLRRDGLCRATTASPGSSRSSTAPAMCCCLSYLSVGGRMALMRGFDPVACMEAIVRDKLTVFVGLSLMYQAILDHPRRREYDLSGLRCCVYTMAPMGRPLLERAMADLCPNFVLSSGQTEMYPATTMSRPEVQLDRFGNYWGESLIVNETAIMDDDGNLLPRGEIGELVHRGPNVMMGYYKDPKATEEARKFGWHHTGDLALIDENGEVLFLDRKKDMIKSGGENVASVKIEETLLAHPAVQNAAVVGLPHPQWGEAVSAFVKLKPGAQASEAEISEHCRKSLGGFQVPKMIRILDDMPMTATGKLRKVELRQAYGDYFAAKSA